MRERRNLVENVRHRLFSVPAEHQLHILQLLRRDRLDLRLGDPKLAIPITRWMNATLHWSSGHAFAVRRRWLEYARITYYIILLVQQKNVVLCYHGKMTPICATLRWIQTDIRPKDTTTHVLAPTKLQLAVPIRIGKWGAFLKSRTGVSLLQ